MIGFIVGGISALIFLTIGFILGYLVGSDKVEETVRRVQRKIMPPRDLSGPVKRMTPIERKLEEYKPVHDRFDELLK